MKLRNIIEIFGIVGVIGSLIFVGIEIRQAANATRSATVLELKSDWVELNLALATTPELVEAFQDVTENKESADPISIGLVSNFYRSLFHTLSNAYYQYRIDTLDEELWQAQITEISTFTDRPDVITVWKNSKQLYDRPFQQLMERHLNGNLHDTD